MTTARTPIFDLSDSFTTTIPIGIDKLPVQIKRFSRTEMEAFEKEWAKYFVAPRGADAVAAVRARIATQAREAYVGVSVLEMEAILARVDHAPAEPLDAAAQASFDEGLLRFIERTLREALTIEDGLIVDRGRSVVDGAGFIDVFHARKDVLAAAIVAVCNENRLSGVIRKNSNSPLGSDGGSTTSAQTNGESPRGAEPGPTAAAAAPKDSAAAADATASPNGGPSGSTTQVH